MTNTTTETKKEECPHIGKLINYSIYQNRIKKVDIANYLGMNRYSISAIVKKPSVQIDLLWKVCKFTNINYIAEIAEKINIPYQTQKEKELTEEIEAVKQENKILIRENELLRELLRK